MGRIFASSGGAFFAWPFVRVRCCDANVPFTRDLTMECADVWVIVDLHICLGIVDVSMGGGGGLAARMRPRCRKNMAGREL